MKMNFLKSESTQILFGKWWDWKLHAFKKCKKETLSELKQQKANTYLYIKCILPDDTDQVKCAKI